MRRRENATQRRARTAPSRGKSRGQSNSPKPSPRQSRSREETPVESSKWQSLDPVQREQVKQQFKTLDKNGDGHLKLGELKDLLQSGTTNKLSDRELKVLFKQVDKDGSGTVEFDEFVDYLWENSFGKGEKVDAEFVVFEVELPMGGGKLQLGGKLGNVVINPGFIPKLKTGWRAIAVNGEKLDPSDVASEIERLNRMWQRCNVTFEVDEASGDRIAGAIEDKIKGASRDILAMLGISDWSEIDTLSDEQKDAVLHDPGLAGLLVDNKSVHGAAMLLNVMGVSDYVDNTNLVQALTENNVSAVAAIVRQMSPKDLLRRDGDGNVPLHLCKSDACVKLLLGKAPQAQFIINNAGRNPLNERLAQHGVACRSDLTSLDTGPCAGMREVLLHTDNASICSAMRLTGNDLSAASYYLPSWEQVCAALDRPAQFIISILEELGGADWPGLISFHCFREVMQEGCHTSLSWSRLRTLWWTLGRLLRGCIARDKQCLAPAKALLKATKGPCCPPIDMRMPYRKDLMRLMDELAHDTGAEVAFHYEHLSGGAAEWLKRGLHDNLSSAILPNCFVDAGLDSRLRMDFELASGTAAPDMLKPEWTQSATPDFKQMLTDLSSVGAVSPDSSEDSVFEMLQIAGLGSEEIKGPDEGDGSLLPLIRLYAAYLRGVCDRCRDQVTDSIRLALGDIAVPGRTFFARPEVKGFPRIVVKSLEALGEVRDEIKVRGIERSDEMNRMLTRSAAFVNDINGATLVCNSPEELKDAFARLQAAMPCLRIKNTYREAAVSSKTDYRDIKLWPVVETDIGFLVVEMQFILAEGFETKKWMHLPYSYSRGDFDWQHGSGLSAEEEFFTAWRLYTGIDGEMEDNDLEEARKFCINSAKAGHLMARAICRREGWGRFKKDDRQAMREFEAAAEAGLPEAKCRLATSLVNSMTNVGRNKARGMELFREAAREGELEALFQLGINETSHRDQKSWLKKAAHLGHQRARRHPLIAMETSNQRVSARLMDF